VFVKSEVAIVAGMAEATVGNTEEVRWSGLAKDYDLIRVRIEQVVSGFKNYNGRVRNPGGFYLPNAVKERSWETPSGKAEFSDAALEQFEVGDGRLILQTLRSHDQYNTTVYGLNDRYRGIGMGRRIIFLNPDDMKERGIQPVSLVNVRSFWDEEIREGVIRRRVSRWRLRSRRFELFTTKNTKSTKRSCGSMVF